MHLPGEGDTFEEAENDEKESDLGRSGGSLLSCKDNYIVLGCEGSGVSENTNLECGWGQPTPGRG